MKRSKGNGYGGNEGGAMGVQGADGLRGYNVGGAGATWQKQNAKKTGRGENKLKRTANKYRFCRWGCIP